MSQWMMLDFVCPKHGRFEVLWDKRDGEPLCAECPVVVDADTFSSNPAGVFCLHSSPPATAYAVSGKVRLAEVSQGKNDQPLPPHILSTRELADGMSRAEWDAKNRKASRDRRHAEIKRELG